jgi:hypothetical protein
VLAVAADMTIIHFSETAERRRLTRWSFGTPLDAGVNLTESVSPNLSQKL